MMAATMNKTDAPPTAMPPIAAPLRMGEGEGDALVDVGGGLGSGVVGDGEGVGAGEIMDDPVSLGMVLPVNLLYQSDNDITLFGIPRVESQLYM